MCSRGPLPVRAGQKADLAVVVAGVVEVDQHIQVAPVVVPVERMILVHRKRLASRRLVVHHRVVQLDVRPEQLRQARHQLRVGHRRQPRLRVEVQLVHRFQARLLVGFLVHVDLAPRAAPAPVDGRPLVRQTIEVVRLRLALGRREHLFDAQEAVVVIELHIRLTERSGTDGGAIRSRVDQRVRCHGDHPNAPLAARQAAAVALTRQTSGQGRRIAGA